ncbi:ABC transporter ATP-binding protein [Rothia sp. 32237D007AR]
MLEKIHILFPGKSFYLLILNCILLFIVSLLDLLGVATILPIIQVAAGADYSSGYLGVIYDLLGQPDRKTLMITLSCVLVLAFIFKGIFSLAIKWWSGGFLSKRQTATSVSMLKAYVDEPYIQHRKRTTAEILQITGSAVGAVYNGYVGSVLTIIGEGLSIILLLLLLAIVTPLESLVAFLYFGITAFLIQGFLKKKNYNAGGVVWWKDLQASEATLNAIDGYRENIIHGIKDRVVYNYQTTKMEAVYAGRLKTFYFDLPKYILEIVFILGITIIIGIMLAYRGLDNIAYMAVFVGACIRILPNFVRVISTVGALRASLPFLEKFEKAVEETGMRSFQFIDDDPDIGAFKEVSESLESITVRIEDLSFRYPDGEKNVLNNINFTVPNGTSVAFVGGSGSGKTTLIDIILGLLEPTTGRVTVNDADIQSNLEKWHQNVGYVPQDVFLSGKSIREEIAYGLKAEEIDDPRVWECIRLAELTDMVKSMECGIYTEIGQNGTRLSGGQRQRIGLARAFYRNPSVLILDEATSALDNETEHKITQAINRLTEGRTVFIVAHRLSTVRNVDQLLYLSNGYIVSQGTFSEVRRDNAEFARLVDLGQLPE